MLVSLSIKNYALIDDLEIKFTDGFTVITGETGAGKSILLGALSLLLGKRADSQVLSDRDRKCIVEGTFDIGSMDMGKLFAENDLDFHEMLYLRREIIPSGRSRAFVNDTPVNVNLLKNIGNQLVDVHSQHETLMLGSSTFQLQVLDDFVDQPEALESYRSIYHNHKSLDRRLQNLIEENERSRRDEDYFQFLCNELEDVKLDAEGFKSLVEKELFLSHAEEVMQSLGTANRLLTEEDHSLIEKIDEITAALERVKDYLPGINALAERLSATTIELKDIADDVSQLNASTEFNPNEMEEVREKLDLIYRLQQKHHVDTIEALVEIRDELKRKLANISSNDEEINSLRIELEKTKVELNDSSDVLHNGRVNKSPALSDKVRLLLGQLGMKDATFEVRIVTATEFAEKGRDKIAFLFSANKGVPKGEVASIASGGELSRLMLAIKSLITKEQLLPTVIFDEIDSGVSGEVAGKVGNILKEMSQHHQLIAISHLPQIAAKADFHFKVYKKSDEQQTYTMLRKLDDNDRVDEIAKLLSDERVSRAALETARELLGN